MGKKLKIGWFSFSCCEDSTIVWTELLNDHYKEWLKLVDFANVRVLKKKGEIKDFDVAFVEGAIANKKDEEELKEIRANSKRLVAIGACAVTGNPSGQRNNFSYELKQEIEPSVKMYRLNRKVFRLEEIVKVDSSVPGCPMNEMLFLNTLEKYLKEFGVV
jgi:coenzyme F420-reducing hydrogenase gamma subunit